MTEDTYAEMVREHLIPFREQLTRELAAIPLSALPQDAILDVEVFPDSLMNGVFASAGFLDASGGRVIGESYFLLDGVAFHIDRAKLHDVLAAPHDFDVLAKNMDLQVEVIAEAWTMAWGQAAPCRAYACRHDDDASFDLNQRRWVIDDEEKWIFS